MLSNYLSLQINIYFGCLKLCSCVFRLVIRIAIDGKSCGLKLSSKFGCEPATDAVELIAFIKEHQMHLQGFSFHAGSPCWDPIVFGRGVEICNGLINTAKSMGLEEVNLIDIGGGIPGVNEDLFKQVKLKNYLNFPNNGRYWLMNNFKFYTRKTGIKKRVLAACVKKKFF